ncbi:MAG TPA: hypothetical protein VFQ53_05225 [Kofleriaceae bacterium]|nr:hypothetical protein [Kofleriaceae bacterium]
MRASIVGGVVIAALVAIALVLPGLRRELIEDVTWWDAEPTDPATLPPATGPGLVPAAHTRVVLIDGLGENVAALLPAWQSVCHRGLAMTVDVGFPTISLPVEVALWSGLTQQQTGIVTRSGGKPGAYGRPLVPPLGASAIPAQVPGSIAIAEDHGWIVRSLGFSHVEPAADPNNPTKDLEPKAWDARWQDVAAQAVASDAKLVFVHVLRVDNTGHKAGVGEAYVRAAMSADALLARLVAADPGARWFVLSDHGHVASGGHGGAELAVRHVAGCIAGPGVVAGRAELVHVVDVSRALADSTGARLDRGSMGRPITAAVAVPLAPDQAVPPLTLSRGAAAIFLVLVGLGLSVWSVRRWWFAPWWFAIACASLYAIRGEPTLSMRMVYSATGREMYLTWLPALALAAVTTWLGARRVSPLRIVTAQLAIPFAVTAAAMAACGAWPVVFGAELAPVVPRYTAWMIALLLMASHGAAVVALAALARLVLRAFGRPSPPEPPRSEPAADA